MSSSCNRWTTAFASSAASNQYGQAPINYRLPSSVSPQNHPVFANQLPTTLSWNSNKDRGQCNFRYRNLHRSVKLPDIRIQKYGGDPLKWNEWSSMITSTIHNNSERMGYLQSFVIGPAEECISSFLCNPNFYGDALNELDRSFGNPQNVLSALTQELEAWQRLQANDHRALISYAALLRKIVQTFLAHGFNADLSAPYLLKLARDKLPNSLKMKWSEHNIDNIIQIRESWNSMDFKRTIEETILWFLTAHKKISTQQTSTATPTINKDPMIKEITKNHFTQAITLAKKNSNNQQSGLSGNQIPNAGITASNATQKVKTKCSLDQQIHYIGRGQQFNKIDVAKQNLEVKKTPSVLTA